MADAPRGLRVVVAAPARGGVGALARGVVPALRADGVTVDTVRLPPGGVPAALAARSIVRHRRALRRADVVQVDFGRLDAAAFWFAACAAMMRRKVVVVAHDVPRPINAPAAGLVGHGGRWREVVGHRLLSPLLDRPISRALWRAVAAVGTFSHAAARGWDAVPAERIVLIEHGADPPTPGALPPSAGRHVLFAGFLGPSKGLDVLLDAWGRLADPPLSLVIAGEPATARDAPWVEDLRRRSAAMPVPPEWLGAVDDAAFARAFARAAIVVLPYRTSNPASGILIRALCEGRAVVVTRTAAADHLAGGRDPAALVVEPGDPDALAAALRLLLGDPDLRDRLGARAARIGAERFTWHNHVRSLRRAYACAGAPA
ncbi:MAG: phosphatidyl-myo-inositol alpha-mannosyltransferase [Solirubrobacteraceae bacterium]